jgi:Arc/MetJ family transcription regulator
MRTTVTLDQDLLAKAVKELGAISLMKKEEERVR